MPPTFEQLNLSEFAALLERFPFERRINALHLHHTWKPDHSQYRGHDTILGMWRYHTQERGWDDIAQHLSIAPDGTLWLGRSFNWAPASAKGHNGNAHAGPFMIEMIGNFDVRADRLEGAQKAAALKVVALVQKHFSLPPESLHFHRHMSSKSCPGSGVEHRALLDDVRKLHEKSWQTLAGTRRGVNPFGDEALHLQSVINEMAARGSRNLSSADVEPLEEGMNAADVRALFSEGEAARGARPELTPEMKLELRPHVINLTQGQFSTGGAFETSQEDVDTLFNESLKDALETAKLQGRPLRLMLYAHGGLVSEKNGLWRAYSDVAWWKQNDVYPLYFVWETGLFEIIGQLLRNSRNKAKSVRDIWDHTTDPLIEILARALGGPTIWAGMKRSAECAVAPDGGAHYFAERFKAFLKKHESDKKSIELHALGHSAGSNFHGFFLPSLLQATGSQVKSLHLLAPAIRVDRFLEQLAPLMGKGVETTTLYTMKRDLERADNCAGLYRKSLLYLIYHALEPAVRTPILGLEESLRANVKTQKLFGLNGTKAKAGEVIWSLTPSQEGRSASGSRTHGGFNDDPATMNSVLRRVLGADANDHLVPFPTGGTRELGGWDEGFDWPEELGERPVAALTPPPSVNGTPNGSFAGPAVTPPAAIPADRGRRRALCVGIDAYPNPQHALAGCVADARAWATTLSTLGFETSHLLDAEATRSGILGSLEAMINLSQPGDVLVFQYAGHGTQMPDVSGDEADQDSPDDEALCAHDFESGAFVIDDDLRELFSQVPAGVNLTCFLDCCHSGSATRLAVGRPAGRRGADERARFLVATDAMVRAHKTFRQRRGSRSRGSARGSGAMRNIAFSACRSKEVAWESGGQGDFTRQAVALLQRGIDGFSNKRFAAEVVRAFGPSPRQNPELDCAPSSEDLGLLQPLGAQPLGRSLAAQSVPQQLRDLALELEKA